MRFPAQFLFLKEREKKKKIWFLDGVRVCWTERNQCARIFKFFRNFGKVLIHLRILKIDCLKCDSKLVTLSPQISPTNQSPTTPQKYFVYILPGVSMPFKNFFLKLSWICSFTIMLVKYWKIAFISFQVSHCKESFRHLTIWLIFYISIFQFKPGNQWRVWIKLKL